MSDKLTQSSENSSSSREESSSSESQEKEEVKQKGQQKQQQNKGKKIQPCQSNNNLQSQKIRKSKSSHISGIKRKQSQVKSQLLKEHSQAGDLMVKEIINPCFKLQFEGQVFSYRDLIDEWYKEMGLEQEQQAECSLENSESECEEDQQESQNEEVQQVDKKTLQFAHSKKWSNLNDIILKYETSNERVLLEQLAMDKTSSQGGYDTSILDQSGINYNLEQYKREKQNAEMAGFYVQYPQEKRKEHINEQKQEQTKFPAPSKSIKMPIKYKNQVNEICQIILTCSQKNQSFKDFIVQSKKLILEIQLDVESQKGFYPKRKKEIWQSIDNHVETFIQTNCQQQKI